MVVSARKKLRASIKACKKLLKSHRYYPLPGLMPAMIRMRWLRKSYFGKSEAFMEGKMEKLDKIRAIIRDDLSYTESKMNFNFLSKELQKKYNIIDTGNVSSNNYDPVALSIIEEHSNGLMLDCGAGKRSSYYTNVVNFEVVPYDTTDVLGVGEELPFEDNSFEAVFSLAVLEHVKDPFKCASEISRVMKPGATLYCVVPFLQPLHG